jgi:hypothetical protein
MVRGALYGALGGVVLGALARLMMRFAALVMQEEPHFNPFVSGVIVGMFALSGAGAGAAAAAGLRALATTLLIGLTSAMLLLTGGGIGVGEALAVYDKFLSDGRTNGVLALASVIGLLALATPYVGWRLGRTAAQREPRSA